MADWVSDIPIHYQTEMCTEVKMRGKVCKTNIGGNAPRIFFVFSFEITFRYPYNATYSFELKPLETTRNEQKSPTFIKKPPTVF